MNLVKKLIIDVLKRPSLYLFIFFIIFTADRYQRWTCWPSDKQGPFFDDIAEYYYFLPTTFIKHDIKYTDDVSSEKYYFLTRRTIGMSVMYSPFFFISDLVAKFLGEEQDGYSEPYKWGVHIGSIFYCLLGLWFCRKNLLMFFNEITTFITLLCVFMGTNLFLYTLGIGEMPHSYLFFLYSVFVFCSLNWILKNKTKYLYILAFTAGLITLIRPTDVLIVLFVPLLKVGSTREFIDRLKFIVSRPLALFFSFVLFMLPLVVQMLFWKKYTGHYIVDMYSNERFFFNDPQIINILFSYRKGWLLYTPMMIFSLMGIVLSWVKLKEMFTFLLTFFCLNLYVLSCWWDWGYGGSFGCRAIIQGYAVLIFPFAVFVSFVWDLFTEKKTLQIITRISFSVVLFLLIKLNLFQSWQYKFGIIHWSGMNEKAYKYVFLKQKLSPAEMDWLLKEVTPPDYNKMLKGERD